jgi:hypothetical protein
MTSRPAAELRRQVIERAKNRCEYCLIHQDDAIASHQIDHVIAEKHGGPTSLENLALSCMLCNLRKGSDLSSIDPATGNVEFDAVVAIRPRAWNTHDTLAEFQMLQYASRFDRHGTSMPRSTENKSGNRNRRWLETVVGSWHKHESSPVLVRSVRVGASSAARRDDGALGGSSPG